MSRTLSIELEPPSDITLAQSIAGVVRWPDGRPAEAKIELVPRGKSSLRQATRDAVTAESDGSGAFAISELTAEAYRVTARSRDRHGVAELEQVQPGTTNLVLILTGGLVLTGRVIDERGDGVTDFSLEGRRIEATATWFREENLPQVFPGPDGSFSVDGLLPGMWEFRAAGREHAPSEPVGLNLPSSAPIELVLPREAGVSGRVVDPKGTPVADATVQATPKNNLPVYFGEEYLTDEQGFFEIRELSPGSVEIVASGSGFAPSEVLSLELTAGETVSEIILRLHTSGSIIGDLVGSDGRPQAGRAISLWAPGFHSRSETDADGRFQITDVPPGEIDLWATTLEGAQLQETVTVGEGETVHVRLAASSSLVRLQGRVLAGGEPFASASLMAYLMVEGRMAPDSFAQAETDEDGAYQLALVGPGRYEVRIIGGKPYLSWQTTVDVPAVATFEFDVSIPLGRISGRVLDSAGRAVSGIEVHADPERQEGRPHGSAQAQTDTEGRYELLVPVGVHVVTAGGWRQELREGSPPYAETSAAGLVVTENGQLRGVDLVLEVGGILDGVVRNPDGSPAGRAFLTCDDENKILGATEEDGSFRILGVTVGKYLVSARGLAGGMREPRPIEIVAGKTLRIELELAGD